jgi:hypothetical protein
MRYMIVFGLAAALLASQASRSLGDESEPEVRDKSAWRDDVRIYCYVDKSFVFRSDLRPEFSYGINLNVPRPAARRGPAPGCPPAAHLGKIRRPKDR